MNDTIMALSLWQPWATLIAIGAKRFETRSWSTNYRGPIAIHATKTMTFDELLLCHESPFHEVLIAAGFPHENGLPLGAILAVGELVACIRAERIGPWLPAQERAFGDYSPGRFAWELADMRLLPEPISARGRQGLWNCTEVLNQRTGAPI